MLINFNCKNYLSFKEEADLSFIASALKETHDLPSRAGFSLPNGYNVLPVASVYGANASGKSNLLAAIAFMKYFVLNSFTPQTVDEPIPVSSFKFSKVTADQPSEFEATFTIGGVIFRYGFEVTSERIMSEWLFHKELKPRSKEKEIFYRDKNNLQYHGQLFKVGKVMTDQELIKKDVLVITLAFQLNEEHARDVIIWFSNMMTMQGHNDSAYQEFSKNQLVHNTPLAGSIKRFIKMADTNIEALSTSSVEGKVEVITSHIVYDGEGHPAGFADMLLNKDESDGTQKLFNMSGYVFHALEAWRVLIVDEMDSKLHPNLMEKIVTMFQDPAINSRGAQLIFATHNTNILDAKLLRRDQIWLTEKDIYGASRLYSIADYKPRNTEAIEQNYVQGKYGGVPFLGDLENFLDERRHEQSASANQ